MSINKNLTVAVVGATGAVGREMLGILLERAFPVTNVIALASKRSAGSEIEFGDKTLTVEELSATSFDGVDIALFSAGGSISEEFAPHAVKSGAIVIDNSSHFRMEEDVPLIVPEANADVLRDALKNREQGTGYIIANPNCSTAQLVVILKPLQEAFGIKRLVVSTYQSVSGAGQAGMDELWEQTRGIFSQSEVEPKQFSRQIAFNCIPHIDVFYPDGYTKEELKLTRETKKILQDPNIKLTATAVRVPVFSCHSEAVNLETDKPFDIKKVKSILSESPGVVVMDNPGENEYPTPSELGGTDATYVGRIRRDETADNAMNLWIVADNLRKGAALNAVQIAEVVLDSF